MLEPRPCLEFGPHPGGSTLRDHQDLVSAHASISSALGTVRARGFISMPACISPDGPPQPRNRRSARLLADPNERPPGADEVGAAPIRRSCPGGTLPTIRNPEPIGADVATVAGSAIPYAPPGRAANSLMSGAVPPFQAAATDQWKRVPRSSTPRLVTICGPFGEASFRETR